MRTRSTLLAVLLLLGLTHVAAAQTAEEVIEKSLTAVGGRAALAKLKSRSTVGTITLSTPAGDINGSVEILNAVPNKVRTLIKADLTALGAGPIVFDQRFDGSTGYVLDSLQGNREMPASQVDALRNSSFPHPFLNYKELGMTVKLTGTEKVGDRQAHVLVFDPTSGPVVRQYVDAETYLPLQTVMSIEVPQIGQEVEQTVTFFDYREVDGVKLPFRFRASASIQSFTVNVTKVEHNGPVDETLFSKPKQ